MNKLAVLAAALSSALAQAAPVHDVLIDLASTSQTRAAIEQQFKAASGQTPLSRLLMGRFLTLAWATPVNLNMTQLEQSKSTASLRWDGFSERMQTKAVAEPDDTYWIVQWGLNDVPTGINAMGAWATTPGNSGVVAVVDTGVLPHEDLQGRLLPGYDFISDAERSHDGTARDSDATDAGDWAEAGECGADKPFSKSSWHGTAVSGVIAANRNNGIGIAGISLAAKILPVRVLGRCGGANADILSGVAWAAGQLVEGYPSTPTPARVINMSLGSARSCSSVEASFYQALAEKGVIVVASAGNDGVGTAHAPSDCPGVISVGAHTTDGQRATYSNYGKRVNISAPAGDSASGSKFKIVTTTNTGARTAEADTYNGIGGTSFSAPHVAGMVSLMLSKNPSLTLGQVGWALERGARPFIAGSNCISQYACGAGMADAKRTLDLVPLPVASSTEAAKTIEVVEFYYKPEDRYFLSTNAEETRAIDAGQAGAFTRTGFSFIATDVAGVAAADLVSVCRFYGRPGAPGPNSHFFTANTAECKGLIDQQALTPSYQARFNYEGTAFRIALPQAGGGCLPTQTPIYRAYNDGFKLGKAVNHRFTTNKAAYEAMAEKKWQLEGVAMCGLMS
jgi:subtilisin family serine protease